MRHEEIDLDHQDNEGDTALIVAAQHGFVAIVKMLREKGANVNIKAKDGNNALTQACQIAEKSKIIDLFAIEQTKIAIIAELLKDNDLDLAICPTTKKLVIEQELERLLPKAQALRDKQEETDLQLVSG